MMILVLTAVWFGVLVSLTCVAAVPSRLQIIGAVQKFTSDFTYPRLADIAVGLHYDGFSEDVVGRLDLTDTYGGNELLTEYVFGLSASVAKKNHTTLFGYPVAENKTLVALSVDPPIVSFSSVAFYEYKGEIGRVPMQIDSWLRYDDNLKIVQWDGVIRRFAWMQTELEGRLAKRAAAELGIQLGTHEYKTPKRILQKRAAIDICEAHTAFCKGENQQYRDNSDCISHLMNKKVFGEWHQIGKDSVICRYVHHGMLEYNPVVHCPHVGPTGGGMCRDRSFTVDTTIFPFKAPFANPP